MALAPLWLVVLLGALVVLGDTCSQAQSCSACSVRKRRPHACAVWLSLRTPDSLDSGLDEPLPLVPVGRHRHHASAVGLLLEPVCVHQRWRRLAVQVYHHAHRPLCAGARLWDLHADGDVDWWHDDSLLLVRQHPSVWMLFRVPYYTISTDLLDLVQSRCQHHRLHGAHHCSGWLVGGGCGGGCGCHVGHSQQAR